MGVDIFDRLKRIARKFKKDTLPPIPQAVVEFADLQEGGVIEYQGKHEDYDVYGVRYPELETGEWGLPTYILYDGKNLKWVYGFDALSLEITD